MGFLTSGVRSLVSKTNFDIEIGLICCVSPMGKISKKNELAMKYNE